MAEPQRKSGPFRIHIADSFDRLLETKLAQAYETLVPCREYAVSVRVKEFDDENGRDLRPGFVGAEERKMLALLSQWVRRARTLSVMGIQHCRRIESTYTTLSLQRNRVSPYRPPARGSEAVRPTDGDAGMR